ncbi:MAG: hypothetical protein FVQ83_07300 [Chloroflexi bacterium]|nr:hypothetical protein [Chloroflexota bacterium]
MDMNMVFLAFLTFLFGLAASSFGARTSKSIEARHKQLEEMAEWVDTVIASVMLFFKVEGKISIYENMEEFAWMSAKQERYSAIANQKKIGSKKLVSSLKEFSSAYACILDIFFSDPAENMEVAKKNLTKINEFTARLTNAAYVIHIEIASLRVKR